MTYSLLAESLRETADRAKSYFATAFGVNKFYCETEVDSDLPLVPTWHATTQDGYTLCIEVRDSPMSPSIYEFVAKCAARGLPIKLWVAIPEVQERSGFTRDLKSAKEMGVGVIQILNESGEPYEHHKPVSMSLFAVKKIALNEIEKKRRETIKKAQDSFLDGSPNEGCRLICEELEAITRRFAYVTYEKECWKPDSSGKTLKESYFANGSWAKILEQLEKRLNKTKVRKMCSVFRDDLVRGVRQYTNWRNSLNHKPKTPRERAVRDAKLRTMFEVTCDILLDWYKVARRFKLDA